MNGVWGSGVFSGGANLAACLNWQFAWQIGGGALAIFAMEAVQWLFRRIWSQKQGADRPGFEFEFNGRFRFGAEPQLKPLPASQRNAARHRKKRIS